MIPKIRFSARLESPRAQLAARQQQGLAGGNIDQQAEKTRRELEARSKADAEEKYNDYKRDEAQAVSSNPTWVFGMTRKKSGMI